MSHRKPQLSVDFANQRNLLDYKPNIDFVEPPQIHEEAKAELFEQPLSLDKVRQETEDLISDYTDIESLADQAQRRINDRAANLVVKLDPVHDSAIIDALHRHFSDPKKNEITFDDYLECINDTNVETTEAAFVVSESDIEDAASDPLRDKFGILGMDNGLARPELQKSVQPIKPIDMKKFKRQQMIQLAIELITLVLGPMGRVQKFLAKKILKFLKRKIKSKKIKKNKRQVSQGIDSELPMNEDLPDGPGFESEDNTEEDIYPIKQQDCNLIMTAFEKGAHHSNSEASVFAPITRNVQNSKLFATNIKKVLSDYTNQSKLSLAERQKVQGVQDASEFQGIKIENTFISIPNITVGDALARAIKECIPCEFRPISSIDLTANLDFLNILKEDVKARLATLQQLADLFGNVDLYGDYCQMVNFLNFMCIPDLQRMLAVLAALLLDNGLALTTASTLLMQLIAPFFTPILMSIQALLDKFVQLVLNPINCIITAINEQARKIPFQLESQLSSSKANNEEDPRQKFSLANLNKLGNQANQDVQIFQGQVRSGLFLLGSYLDRGSIRIQEKLTFYTDQVRKLLRMWGGHDFSYLNAASNKLITIRLIGLVTAMIKAKGKGVNLCPDNGKPGPSELDNFFGHFLNPGTPFTVSVDKQGNLIIAEVVPDKKDSGSSGGVSVPKQPILKPKNVIDMEPVDKVFKCAVATSQEDVARVNEWMSQLDKESPG